MRLVKEVLLVMMVSVVALAAEGAVPKHELVVRDQAMTEATTEVVGGTVTLQASAQEAVAAEDPSDYCDAASCGSLPTEEAGSVNPYQGKESATCKLIKVYDKQTCESRCLCNHQERTKKCNGGRQCLAVQQADYEACLSFCLTDFP